MCVRKLLLFCTVLEGVYDLPILFCAESLCMQTIPILEHLVGHVTCFIILFLLLSFLSLQCLRYVCLSEQEVITFSIGQKTYFILTQTLGLDGDERTCFVCVIFQHSLPYKKTLHCFRSLRWLKLACAYYFSFSSPAYKLFASFCFNNLYFSNIRLVLDAWAKNDPAYSFILQII